MVWWLWLLIVLAVVAAVSAALVSVAVRKRRARTAALRNRFGPEYDRTVEAAGGSRAGEDELEKRLERRRGLSINGMPNAERTRYEEEWAELQNQFEGSELAAIARADALVTSILADCGYPLESFDQRAGDLSVDYPEEVGHYRRAHAVYRRADDGDASREDMYEALQHYRALFEALLGSQLPDSGSERPQRPPTPIEQPVENRNRT